MPSKITPDEVASQTASDSELTFKKKAPSKVIAANSSVTLAKAEESTLLRFVRLFCCSMSSCTAFGFISMAIAISLIVWLSTFVSGYISTSAAIDSLRVEIRTTALSQLNNVLVAPMLLLKDQRAMAEELDIDISTPQSMYHMARHMTRVIDHHREIDVSFFLQFPNGNYLRVMFTDATKQEVTVTLRDSASSESQMIQLSAGSADFISSKNSTFEDKILGTTWYQQAIFEDRSIVSLLHELHEADNTGARLGFTYTLPMFVNGTLKCVFGADLGLNNIGLLLQNLRIGKTGSSFLMQRSGIMIATSAAEVTLADGSGVVTHVTDTHSELHAKIGRLLESSVTIEKVQDSHSLSFDGHVADVYELDPVLGTGNKLLQRPWLFVTALPLFRDYTQVILWSTLLSLLVTVVLIAMISMASVLLYIAIFVRPLRRLIKDLESVQSMQLDDIKERKLSVIFETRELQKRFYKSVHYLRLFKQFLPQSLLDAQVASLRGETHEKEKVSPDDASSAMSMDISTSKHTRTTRSSSNSYKRRMKERAALSTFEVGVRESKMAILSVGILHSTQVIDIDVDSFCRQHSAMLSAFGSTVRIHKGTVERFDDHIMVASFFTLKQAASAAVELKKKLLAIEKKLHHEERHNVSFCIGLSYGLVCFGVLGSDKMRVNHIFGKGCEMSRSLSRIGATWASKIIVDHATYQVLDVRNYVLRPICWLRELGDDTIVITRTSSADAIDGARVYEIMSSSKVTDSEWLYERRDAERISAVDMYRNAFTCMEKQRYNEARSLLREYLKLNSDDEVAAKHLQHIEEQLDSE